MPSATATPDIQSLPSAQFRGNGSAWLFEVGEWIGLKANNQYGFDIVRLAGDHYESVLINNNQCDTLMQVFGGYLKQNNVLESIDAYGSTGTPATMTPTSSLSPQARGAATRRARAQSK